MAHLVHPTTQFNLIFNKSQSTYVRETLDIPATLTLASQNRGLRSKTRKLIRPTMLWIFSLQKIKLLENILIHSKIYKSIRTYLNLIKVAQLLKWRQLLKDLSNLTPLSFLNSPIKQEILSILGVQLCFCRFPIDGFSDKWQSK